MKQGKDLERDKNVQAAEQEEEDKIAKMLSITASQLAQLSKQQFLDLQRQLARYTDQRLDSISLIIRRESRIRQILSFKYSNVFRWGIDHIFELTKQIQQINDERLSRYGRVYFSEVRYLILVKQLDKQRQLSWKKWFSFFKRSGKNQDKLNENERERLTNWDHQQVNKQMQLKSNNHSKSTALQKK